MSYLLKFTLALCGHCPAPTILLGLFCPWMWDSSSKGCSFHYRGLEYQSRKWRIPGVTANLALGTEWSRAKANRVLPTECTGHSKHPLPTTQEKSLHMNITRCSIPKSDLFYYFQPKMENLNTVREKKKDRELTVAQIMNTLLLNSDVNWRK